MERKFDMIRSAFLLTGTPGIQAPVKRRPITKRERARDACFVDDTGSRMEAESCGGG